MFKLHFLLFTTVLKVYYTASNRFRIPACVLPIDAVPCVVLSKSHHIGWTPRKSPVYRMHEPCLLDWRPVFDANWVCVCECVEKCVRRGYSSLSLRTKSLYICTYVVLKSYTFGLSGVGPGSFTWDPVPNDRTSNPRLLQRNEKNKTANYILICSNNKGDTKWLAFCLISLDLDTWTTTTFLIIWSLSSNMRYNQIDDGILKYTINSFLEH